jgi:hypothetical protein
MQYYKIDLTGSSAQLNLADWVVDAMQDTYEFPEDAEELWGKNFEECPVRLEFVERAGIAIERTLFIVNDREVVDDFLYRIQTQYVEMAKSEGVHEYRRALNAVTSLSNKITQSFNS